MFERVLIANRGEIAVRIIRTLREMGITSIVAFSDADRNALFVQQADEAYHLGPTPAPESYLSIDAILSVARSSRAEAIHPGYGFLAENADFAQAVENAGLTFIGPSSRAIRAMGDKVRARRLVSEMGVPVVPGTPGPVSDLEEALAFGERAGYPVAVKAAAGGGGRGIRVVQSPHEMEAALAAAQREASTHFNNPEVYLERYFPDPRHVEIQVLGDKLGHLVHLGERDCSVQRRHQKVIEEAPSPAVDRELRARMGEMAIRAARSVEYDSAGTVECLLTREGEFYFLEMNTRIQVEHPVTEWVTGVDLVREMVLAAAGKPISVRESVLEPRGHAIEIRINAEDPRNGFRPTPATITALREPGGLGVRFDSGVCAGYSIPQAYDSLIAKLIAWGPDRERARCRTLRALGETHIEGPSTTIPFAEVILRTPAFVEGEIGTTYVGRHLDELEDAMGEAAASASTAVPNGAMRGDERCFEVEVNRKLFQVKVAELLSERRPRERKRRSAAHAPTVHQNAMVSPMHGTVVAIRKRPGDTVTAGETVFIVEAMKMENEISARHDGRIASIDVQLGQTVEAGEVLAALE